LIYCYIVFETLEVRPEFAAIPAVAVRHNDISDILSTTPDRFGPHLPS
jgi:hypothetical protein